MRRALVGQNMSMKCDIFLLASACAFSVRCLFLKKLPPYTLAGFDLTTHSSGRDGGNGIARAIRCV
jgi:hypothetical protein